MDQIDCPIIKLLQANLVAFQQITQKLEQLQKTLEQIESIIPNRSNEVKVENTEIQSTARRILVHPVWKE